MFPLQRLGWTLPRLGRGLGSGTACPVIGEEQVLLQGALILHTTGEAELVKTHLSAHVGTRCDFSQNCLCWWERVYKPGEHVQFNLNFIHIPYNNEIAGTGILTIMLYENYTSIFSQMKHHTDFISFFFFFFSWKGLQENNFFNLLSITTIAQP